MEGVEDESTSSSSDAASEDIERESEVVIVGVQLPQTYVTEVEYNEDKEVPTLAFQEEDECDWEPQPLDHIPVSAVMNLKSVEGNEPLKFTPSPRDLTELDVDALIDEELSHVIDPLGNVLRQRQQDLIAAEELVKQQCLQQIELRQQKIRQVEGQLAAAEMAAEFDSEGV